MNTKMLGQTVHFFNADLAEDIPTQEYPKILEAAIHTYTTTQSFLKTQKNSQEHTCTGVSLNLQPSTSLEKRSWDIQLSESFAKLLSKTSCELVLKGEFYEKWRTEVLIIIKRYREVDNFFKKQTLRGKVYIREPQI